MQVEGCGSSRVSAPHGPSKRMLSQDPAQHPSTLPRDSLHPSQAVARALPGPRELQGSVEGLASG